MVLAIKNNVEAGDKDGLEEVNGWERGIYVVLSTINTF